MNNWIDLSEIPKIKKHGRLIYNWENSIGCCCNFCCQGILGQIKIIHYDATRQKFTVSYKGNVKFIDMGSLKNASLRTVIGTRNKDFERKYKTKEARLAYYSNKSIHEIPT